VKPLMRVTAFITGLLPVSCHYAVTAPRLWAHNSSAAFNAWLALWVFGILFLCMCWVETFKRSKP
jgi:hypothetical protein